jgi:hypothetical protein
MIDSTNNTFDPRGQVRAGHAGDTGERRLEGEAAGIQNAFRVDVWIATETKHVLIAGALTLFEQSGSEPPYDRVRERA